MIKLKQFKDVLDRFDLSVNSLNKQSIFYYVFFMFQSQFQSAFHNPLLNIGLSQFTP